MESEAHPAAEESEPHASEQEGQKLTVVRELEKDRGVIAMIASGFGVIPLSVAVVLHEGSTIVVVLNALRLLAWREPAIST